jgi:diguanylate cyclase (GGDEF)-like protein
MPEPIAGVESESLALRAEEMIGELRRTMGRLEAALACISEALAITDKEGALLWCNQPFESLVQRNRMQLLGRSIQEALPQDVNGRSILSELPSEGTVGIGASRQALLAREPIKAVAIECRPVLSEPERPLVFCLRDISVDLTHEAMQREVMRIAEERHQLAEQVLVCAVTGLPNRRALERRLAEAFGRLAQRPGLLTVLFCDLDGFKKINDTHGHAAGDALLVTVGQRLQGCLRQSDLVARLGGDEFVVLSEGPRNATEAWELAQRLQQALTQPWMLDDRSLRPAMSVGIAMTSDPDLGSEALLRQADLAMYDAKSRGDRPISMHDTDIELQARARQQLGRRLREAIERRQPEQEGLFIVYRPVVQLSDGGLEGLEAELRIEPRADLHLELQSFPLIAERVGVMPLLGHWMRGCALERLQLLRQQGENGTLALQLRASELKEPGFIAVLQQQADGLGVDLAWLVIELDDGLMRAPSTELLGQLDGLRALGVRLVLDDFGARPMHLADLLRLPLDAVKVHHHLGQDPVEDGRRLRLRHACVRLALDLGLEVIADGIETECQLQELRTLGCRWGQGPLFGDAQR